MSKFCSKCGTKLEDSDRFCQACGTQVQESQQQPSPNQQQNFRPSNTDFNLDQTFQDMFFKTHGRLNCLRYFKRSLLLVLAEIFIFIVIGSILDIDFEGSSADVLSTCIALIALYPEYCLLVRRIEDLDRQRSDALVLTVAGALVALFNVSDFHLMKAISFAYGIYMLYIMIKDGTHGPNQYGEDPLNR